VAVGRLAVLVSAMAVAEILLFSALAPLPLKVGGLGG
jgi:hypothetical protein